MAAPQPPYDFEALFRFAPGGLARTADDGTFLAVNDTLCAWLGRPAETLVGRAKLQELLTMGGRIFHQTHWAPLLRMQGSVSEVKLDIAHANGELIPMMMNAVRRDTADGFVHEVLMIVARDRDAYERELVASRRKLQALVEESARLHAVAKDRALFAEQMVGIVSHDLRNPLSTVQMGAALLAKSPKDPVAILGRLSRAADRAIRLVSDLLDFTQARMGQGLRVSPAPMNLRACVADAVEELSLAYPSRTVVHQHEGASECTADADRLAQIVGNLVSNAIAYGREDGLVYVRSEVQDRTAKVSVRNEGEPIPADLQATLFKPMVRGDVDAGSRSVGLGLFIVAQIAKAHGGAVSVSSTAAEGTRFEVAFPADGGEVA